MEMRQTILDAVLETEDDAITVINKDKKVLYWNEAAVKTYNISKGEIINQPITLFFDEKDLIVLEVLHTEKHIKNMYHQPRQDKHVLINSSPIFNEEGDLIGSVSVERDITQIVKLNDNLETTSEELNELRRKVKSVQEDSPFFNLVGKSNALLETTEIAKKAAKTNATTLILGESGTGKEVCARAIHDASLSSDGPFVPVNCGAIPPALFESELFGYEKGTFTGASQGGKAGKIEMADGGTLFLDEVGELPLEMQVKLLRVLQESRVYRLGNSTGKEVNVRIIAATNKNLEQMMADNKFRSDLYYRLNVIQLTMPPLRDRIDDIPDLVKLFLQKFANKYQVSVPKIEQSALQMLLRYHWPGNVRELKNMMERIVILTEKRCITAEDLSDFFPNIYSPKDQKEQIVTTSLVTEKKNVERILIEDTLIKTNGNKSDAARRLGISRVTLYNKIKKYNLMDTKK